MEACVARAEAELGPIDVLVNNAGVFLWRPFLELSSEEWDLVLATNLTGAANFCRAVLPGMIGRRRGRIVNVSSIHGMRGEANLAAHSAAKFGLIGLTQSLAREYRSYNIAVNAVCPGTVENQQDETGAPSRSEPLAEKLWPRDVAQDGPLPRLRRRRRDHGGGARGLRRDAPGDPAVTSRRRAAQPVRRCPWAEGDDPLLRAYHDEEWGVPSFDDRHSSSS